MLTNSFATRYFKILLSLFFFTVYSDLSTALRTDQDQPIELSSNTAVRNEQGGYTVYSGDVMLKQGSLSIKADVLKVFHAEGPARRIIAFGTPVNLTQKPDTEKATIEAAAFEIIYERDSNLITLKKNAELKQASSIVKGDKITYSISEQKVVAESDVNTTNNRVNVILPRDILRGGEE